MKHILTLALLSFCLVANAQTISIHGKTISLTKLRNEIHDNASKNQIQYANKTTVIKQRLIAESSYDSLQSTPYLLDTNKFIYSGYNGSKFINGSTDFSTYYPPMIVFGSDTNIYSRLGVSADTMLLYGRDQQNQNLVANTKNYATFSNGQINTFESWDTYNQDTFRIINEYNANNKLTTMWTYRINYNTNQFDSSEKRVFVYNSQGYVLHDTIFSYDLGDWTPSVSIEHVFDLSGNETQTIFYYFTGSIWIGVLKADFTFYPDKKVKTIVFSQNQGSGLALYSRDSMAYSANFDYATRNWSWLRNGAVWGKDGFTFRHLNPQNLMDTLTIGKWNSSLAIYDTIDVYAFTYNNYNNPILREHYSFSTGTPQLSQKHYFFYQEYTDLSVGDENTKLALVSFFPNPIKEELTIELKNLKGKFMCEVYDVFGNLILTNQVEGRATINLSGKPLGIYFVNIISDNGSLIGSGKVMKQ